MSEEELVKKRVDDLIDMYNVDNERAHEMEDAFHLDLIRAYCPPWVWEEVNRLNSEDIIRWYA